MSCGDPWILGRGFQFTNTPTISGRDVVTDRTTTPVTTSFMAALSARMVSLMAENTILKAEIHTLRTLVMGLTSAGKPKLVTDWTAFSRDPSAPLIEK